MSIKQTSLFKQTVNMSFRKEVFQEKVLQRLYPTTLKVGTTSEAPVNRPQANKSFKGVQVKPSKLNIHAGLPAVSNRKMYTVLPPPEHYIPASGDGLRSPSDAQVVNNADELAADLSGSEDRNAAEDDRMIRKRKRRRKRTPATLSEGQPLAAAAADKEKTEDAEERNKGNAERSELLSKNKKRKMKKKRHKEKLLALGLVPSSAALEFIYKQSEEKEEDEDKKTEEVLDFLHSTRELYPSDRSGSTGDPSAVLSATDSLFTRLSDVNSPPADLSILRRLRAPPRQSDVENLHQGCPNYSQIWALEQGP